MALRVCRKYSTPTKGGRLMSSPPLPPTTQPLSHPPTTPLPYPYTYWGGLWVSQWVWGGGGRGAQLVNLPFPRKFWRTLRSYMNRLPFKVFSILSFLILCDYPFL